jgi:hypothetical protein
MSISDYERARLLLQAFAMLDGWGVTNEKGIHVPYTLQRRKEAAAEFVEWALTPDADEEAESLKGKAP